MMPKPTKVIKKGYDPTAFIALGTRTKEGGDSQPTVNNIMSTISNNSKETSKDSLSSSSNASESTGKSANKISSQNSSSSLSTMGSNTTSTNNTSTLDPKTIRDEINKALEKDESNEKLSKLVRSIIINLKNGLNAAANPPNNNLNKPQNQIAQQQQPQQLDLNFVIALSYVALKRPQLFIKQSSLLEFLCTNLLYTNKSANSQDKLSNSSNILKSKSLHLLRASPQTTSSSIHPTICTCLFNIFEHESNWPDLFVKAFIDDSLGERSWVENSQCEEFVENIKTAFATKPIPFSVETNSSGSSLSSSNSPLHTIGYSNSSSDLSSMNKNDEDSQMDTNDDKLSKNYKLVPRYSANKAEVEAIIVDTARTMFSNGKPQITAQRIQNSTQASINNLTDNRNFLKLLQNTCGISEIRTLAMSKMEAWLANPKLTSSAQDLLMSICVNCEPSDRDLISQIVKLKPKIKQHQPHYYDCIREMIKSSPVIFEYAIQMSVLNDLAVQIQQLQQQQVQPQSLSQARNQHNLLLLQTAFSTDGALSSKLLAQTMQRIILQRNGDDYLRLLRILLRDTIRNSRNDFDLLKFTKELVNDNLIKQYYFGSVKELSYHNSTSICFGVAGGLADFSLVQVKEKFVNGICDLITVCILVAITPQIKDAYLRRQHDTREILIKYYMLMSQIQCDTVTWLQEVVRFYNINPTEMIRCMFKILFMIDKPEQCYTIDNWPSEQERSTMFRVVSEIPVLSETLHQVLMITKVLPDDMYLHMLRVEENLLKLAALVHNKDIYSLKLNKIDQFVQSLFNICLYKFQVPSTLVVTVLYWRAWQILLIVSALDPKGFGVTAWEQYPTLRVMMEMIMIDDYNFPPQSSITEEMTIEKFRYIDNQVCLVEKQEILEFENMFEMKQGNMVRNESNSKLIGQIMKFDPKGPPRRPPPDAIQNIRKLNSEYKLGQLLCKSRQPDLLLDLIKRQNSKLSLPWLSSLIESSTNDCLEIMPIQCICEFVWNLLSGAVEEIPLKKQFNIEQLLYKIKLILTTNELSDSLTIQQIKDTFDYFLNKLCSDKLAVRNGALKILNRLFIVTSIEKLYALQQLQQPLPPPDLGQLIDVFKSLSAFDICLKPLLIKYFRRAILVETNPDFLNLYLHFLFEQLLHDYKQQIELESSLQMELENSTTTHCSISIKNESFKNLYNEIAIDLSEFFFKRNYYLNTLLLLKHTNSDSPIESKAQLNELVNLRNLVTKYAVLMLKMNEYNMNDPEVELSNQNIKLLIKNKQLFDRQSLDSNSFILIETKLSNYLYINEKIYNLVIYFYLIIIQLTNYLKHNLANRIDDDANEINENIDENFDEDFRLLTDTLLAPDLNYTHIKYLNCKFDMALNDTIKDKLFKFDLNAEHKNSNLILSEELNNYFEYSIKTSPSLDLSSHKGARERILRVRLVECLIESMSDNLYELVEVLVTKFGISSLSTFLIINKIESMIKTGDLTIMNRLEADVSQIYNFYGLNVKHMCKIIESNLNRYKLVLQNVKKTNIIGEKFLNQLKNLRDKLYAIEANKANKTGVTKLEIFSFSKPEFNDLSSKNLISGDKLNDYSIDSLNKIKEQIDNLKKRNRQKLEEKAKKEDEQMVVASDQPIENSNSTESLINLINESSNQNLESNLNKKLNEMSSNERIKSLTESILVYENKDLTPKKCLINYRRCIVDILLDYFCHFDPQIINKEFEIEYRLLFELRNNTVENTVNESYMVKQDDTQFSTSAITQSFLLSLFIHQANWQKLYDCVQYLLSKHSFFSTVQNNYRLNPIIVLDFLSSLIHIPELWKGTEFKLVKKYDEENVINLDENQTCVLIDYLIEEMCILYEKNRIQNEAKKQRNDDELFADLKYKLIKRVQLVKHFLKSSRIKKDSLFDKIILHLQNQKQHVSKMKECLSQFNNNNCKINHENVLIKIQHLFLYCIYLEENSIINHITNPNRLFSNFYYKIDIPTQFDVKAHNLLNCFGEIEVNYSNNLTSSGIIGVASVPTHFKHQEKQEIMAFNKKQEAFMIDANLVCVKLASAHPFIFLRQIPMMEGLLQGRVVYSFDEFKRRKFDKLFHYIIDILNILVPYVFHRAYLEHVEAIISHYFDMFMSYCSDNREFIGSLVLKFVDFLEKFINSDIQVGHSLIIRRYSHFISFLHKSYPEIIFLNYLNSIESIPFESLDFNKNVKDNNILKSIPADSLKSVNVLNQRSNLSLWSSKQLEPFINKILNRDSFDGVFSVLQELDTVSQRQPVILSHFVSYLQPLMQDLNDQLRDISFSLIMRYLRLNPRETPSFHDAFMECVNSSNSKIFNSAIKVFADFNLLSSDKSENLIKSALKGSIRHSVDISKQLTDSIRLMQLEKYVY